MGTVHAKTVEVVKEESCPGEFPPKEGIPRLPYNPRKEDIPNKKPADYDSTCDNTEREINVEGIKVRVDRVHVDGVARTKNDILEDCFEELFSATDFQDVLINAHRAKVKLEELGCFKNIGIFVDTSKGFGATPDGLEVTYSVKEYKRLTGGVSTQVGNNEGALLVGLRAPNIFGRGERIQVEYTHGSRKSSNFNVAFIKPFRGIHRPVLTASIFQANNEYVSSGYKQLDNGLLFDFGFHSYPLIKHNIQWEGVIRNMGVMSKSSSFDVREQAGATLKSAIRHILSCDLRDDPIFPTGGLFMQLTSELAGLGGNIGFFKNEVYLQSNLSIIEDFVFQGTFAGGLMRGIFNDTNISISDNFFLGGPTSVRGFQMRGIGPQSDGDALGALGYWSAGLHLFTPLPFRPGRGGLGELFRTHFFANVGNIGEFKLNEEQTLLPVLSDNLRISYGLGLALRLGTMARLEVNYCFPFQFDQNDQALPGVQFGIGVQFL